MDNEPTTNEVNHASTPMDTRGNIQRAIGTSERSSLSVGQYAPTDHDPNAEPADRGTCGSNSAGLIGLEQPDQKALSLFTINIYQDSSENLCVDYEKSPNLIGGALEIAEILHRVIDNTMKSLAGLATKEMGSLLHKPSIMGELMEKEIQIHAPDLTDFLDGKFKQ